MLIQNTLLEFDLETTVIDVQVGPIVTRYALQPHKEDGSERIRMNRIASYARDLSLALAAKRLRMETPVPGTNYMGIEVPNKEPGIVALRNVLESDAFKREKAQRRAPLLIPLGRNVTGEPVSIDLAQMPAPVDRRRHRLWKIGVHGRDCHIAAHAMFAERTAVGPAGSQDGGTFAL